jgi:hypothetical protein
LLWLARIAQRNDQFLFVYGYHPPSHRQAVICPDPMPAFLPILQNANAADTADYPEISPLR